MYLHHKVHIDVCVRLISGKQRPQDVKSSSFRHAKVMRELDVLTQYVTSA